MHPLDSRVSSSSPYPNFLLILPPIFSLPNHPRPLIPHNAAPQLRRTSPRTSHPSRETRRRTEFPDRFIGVRYRRRRCPRRIGKELGVPGGRGECRRLRRGELVPVQERLQFGSEVGGWACEVEDAEVLRERGELVRAGVREPDGTGVFADEDFFARDRWVAAAQAEGVEGARAFQGPSKAFGFSLVD